MDANTPKTHLENLTVRYPIPQCAGATDTTIGEQDLEHLRTSGGDYVAPSGTPGPRSGAVNNSRLRCRLRHRGSRPSKDAGITAVQAGAPTGARAGNRDNAAAGAPDKFPLSRGVQTGATPLAASHWLPSSGLFAVIVRPCWTVAPVVSLCSA